MSNIEEKDFYITLPGDRSLIIGADGIGLCLSFHFRSGHVMVSMDRDKAFEVLEAIQSILTPEWD
jgi:hypothetical protein